MTAFNLRHLIREVLDNSTLTDPHAIASEVGRRIDDSDLRLALAQCLAHVVREEIRSSRNGGLPILPSLPAALRPEAPRLTLHTRPEVMTDTQPKTMQEQPSGAPRPVIKATPARPAGRSAKVAAIRESGPRWLHDRLNTGADPREWKRIGDCTFTDLMFAATQRRDQAARTSAAAERLERLAELLRSHGVDRVRDLPESILTKVGGAAA
ncbi:hypothetical protein ABT099_23705 [Streptomyces prasinus]|uniref:hypothetical protein n=1 Tax=Streptomyces prasinus TaxID=67345 RepID=UPI00332A98DF